MTTRTLFLAVATVGAAALATIVTGTSEARAVGLRCSMIEIHPARGDRDVVLVGTALGETARAGAGSVEFDVAPGEDRAAARRAIRGELVSVEALDRRARAQLPAGTTRVLLVPWGSHSDCRPFPWDHARRWLDGGGRGLFIGTLRDRAHWADSVPTLDVHDPYQKPYTGDARRARDTVPALTPDELLGLYDAVRADRDPVGMRASVRAWVRANPRLAKRRPAPELLAFVREPGETPRYHHAASPLLGTWRLDASLDGATPRTGWVRTWDRTSHATTEEPTPAALAVDPLAAPRVVRYHAVVAGDTALAGLPTAARPFMVRQSGYLTVAVPNDRAPLDAPPWQGAFERDVLAHAFAGDTAIVAHLREEDAESMARYRARSPARPTAPPPATFTRDADGTLRVEQRTALADGRTLVIRGVRVSAAMIRDGAPDR